MNKKIKKLLAISLSILCLVASLVVQVVAEEDYSCGDDLVWTLSEDSSVIIISGSGDMYDYSYINSPWEVYKSDITTVIISEGVTSIGKNAFYDCAGLTIVYISQSVTQISAYAFYECSELETVYYGSTQESWTDILIDDSVNLDEVSIVYSHIHIDEDGDEFCDECGATVEKKSWSLIEFIKNMCEVIVGYVTGFIALISGE